MCFVLCNMFQKRVRRRFQAVLTARDVDGTNNQLLLCAIEVGISHYAYTQLHCWILPRSHTVQLQTYKTLTIRTRPAQAAAARVAVPASPGVDRFLLARALPFPPASAESPPASDAFFAFWPALLFFLLRFRDRGLGPLALRRLKMLFPRGTSFSAAACDTRKLGFTVMRATEESVHAPSDAASNTSFFLRSFGFKVSKICNNPRGHHVSAAPELKLLIWRLNR